MDRPMTRVPRCRAAGPSRNIWARQCDKPAKGERLVDAESGRTIPACGIHLNARYVYEYRPSPTSRYELPIEETMVR